MQETQNNELFSDISTEESAAINGGHGCGCDGYSRSVSYGRRDYYYGDYGYGRSVSYSYRRPGYDYHHVTYRPGGCY
ncbi:hypothetical protein [Okeania sp.]|uniref:hypothetical protein n=1 Tax=Okeania sp. TaxID=3100323 RepID=UPI002B4B7EA0|nr:hypothetical protein [Okeania sp.]MEB3343202.1 hypothetical protein [Okeania sp.]